MTIPVNYTSFYGKANLVASFNNFLLDTVQGGHLGVSPLATNKDFYWQFDYPILPQQTPAISTTEIGLFSLGPISLEKLLGHDSDGDPIFGIRNQTLMEIDCIDQDTDGYTSATQNVRRLRDRVIAALTVETIPFKDFNNPSRPQIGIIEVDSASNAINEKFLVDATNQNVKRYVIMVRIFWTEIFRRVKTKTINASAKIA
jgi:hypothetical protein